MSRQRTNNSVNTWFESADLYGMLDTYHALAELTAACSNNCASAAKSS